jgi:hypothetical protein
MSKRKVVEETSPQSGTSPCISHRDGELETLWPSRRPTEPAALETAAAAWAVSQAPEATALVEWATKESTDLPFLAPALQRLLGELPAPTNGLSRTERHALEAIDAGARTPPAAFVAAQRLEDARFLGDTCFYRSLSALGQGTKGLVGTEAGPRFRRHPHSATTDSSPASRYGSPQTASAPYAAKPTASNCSASTARSAAPISPPTTPGDGTPPDTSSFHHVGTSHQLQRHFRVLM